MDGLEVFGVEAIMEVINHFNGKTSLEPTVVDTRTGFYKNIDFPEFDFSDVKGKESIKQCMEIAAAGGHNIRIAQTMGLYPNLLSEIECGKQGNTMYVLHKNSSKVNPRGIETTDSV